MHPVLQNVPMYRQIDGWRDGQTDGWTDHLTGGLSTDAKMFQLIFLPHFGQFQLREKNALRNNGPMDYRTINQWTDKVF